MIHANNIDRRTQASEHPPDIDVQAVVDAILDGAPGNIRTRNRGDNLSATADEQPATFQRTLGKCVLENRTAHGGG